MKLLAAFAESLPSRFPVFPLRGALLLPGGNLPLNIFGILSNDLLLAIPFFTFMGAILEKCGLAEDMLDSMGQLFGPIRGGLGYSVIIVGFILGAITGTVAAQVIAMAGNPEIILCERGIRTFETATRNTLDIAAVPVLKAVSHLPIVVDPSQGEGGR